MAFNTLLIKRRLPTSGALAGAPAALSGGELAFNEVDSTLYYGASAGIISIAGSGAYVDRTTSQTIWGDKTFVGSTTLSSVTFSADSAINAGSNKISNVAVPTLSADAATKDYVDQLGAGVAVDFVDRTTAQDISGNKTFFDSTIFKDAVIVQKSLSATSFVSASAYQIDGTTVIDNNRNGSFVDVSASGNLTVTGNLSVLGNSTSIETTVSVASAMSITNVGTGPALTVTQTGANDIATFYDDANTALIVKDGGNVGINTATPNEKLTVSGNISASGNIYGYGTLEIGSGTTTLYVGTGIVGVNTETPNEAFTVVGSVSATQNVYGISGVSNLIDFVVDCGSF